jgi:hypothetical protein
MPCTGFSGFSPFQTWNMKRAIRKIEPGDRPKTDYSIGLLVPVDSRQQDSLWFDGPVAEIFYQGFIFSIEVCGRFRAFLYDAATDELVASFSNKSGDGSLRDKLLPYFRTDTAFWNTYEGKRKRYRLEIEEGNWFEVFVLDNGREWLAETWVAEGGIFKAITETLQKMDSFLSENTGGK